MNNYDNKGNYVFQCLSPRLKGGKGDPNGLRNKANSKNKPKWMRY